MQTFRLWWLRAIGILSLVVLIGIAQAHAPGRPVDQAVAPETVYFPSADGHTELVAYLFHPAGPGPFPAIVMLHGRSGPYSSTVSARCTFVGRDRGSPCGAGTLSARTNEWGRFWAARGVMALHVDSFGPRGVAHGFGRFTHGDADREAVNERTVRPLDADGALGYLRTRGDVRPRHIALQGWSHGASTTLNTLSGRAAGLPAPHFLFALAFYPGCGPAAVTARTYQADGPLQVFLGSDDEEVSPRACRELLAGAPAGSGEVGIEWYEGATHDFDDPGTARQSIAANRQARERAMALSAQIAERYFVDIGR